MAKDIQGKLEVVLVTRDEMPGNPVDQVEVTWEGFVGDKHFGLTRKAGSSQNSYPKGTEIRNVRQISIVSPEELKEVADAMQIPTIKPEWVGANLLISGVPDLTKLPPGSRLYFENGVGIVIDGENMPCVTAGGSLQEQYPDRDDLQSAFPKRAIGKRGLVGWVERPGILRKGESVTVRLAQDVRS